MARYQRSAVVHRRPVVDREPHDVALEDESVDHVWDDHGTEQHAAHQDDVAVADVSRERDRSDDTQAEADQ
jgi:hypothetical protein